MYEQYSLIREFLVCRLFKALYELNQAPRVWIKKANKILKVIGLEPIFINETCFIIPDKELICSIYVDNF
jgi:hypothetical protein